MPVLLSGALLVVPLLASRTQSSSSSPRTVRAGATPVADPVRATAFRASRSAFALRPNIDDAMTTSTTAPPTTATTAKPKPRAASVAPGAVAVVRPKPKPTTTTTTAPPTHHQSGSASWYSAPAGDCAHRTLPMGTVLIVTNVANGKQVRCTVSTRGPFTGGRILDLSKATFQVLASASTGVIDVRIDWY